ncbi:MAG: glycoside hydrolase family 2 TIM barrel-domain containing protein [Bryobacteraceae bacterium]|nr:glycoside hydrolase family 2 TIM barrel-domain containing protein [Bryobacteraceae bacterium]
MDTPYKHGYPRPQLERKEWIDLNGAWDFALDPEGVWQAPQEVVWNATIQVPYTPETPASGIGQTGFFRAVWYRRTVEVEPLAHGRLLLLHFGAVDHTASVWINGQFAGGHEGGYTPFTLDITGFLVDGGPQTIVVRAWDDPAELSKPRGKQDWQLNPHSIWYPRTTGIWQTVWLERVPATYIGYVRFTPIMERWEIGFEGHLHGSRREGLRMSVRLSRGDQLIADDTYTVVAGEVHRRIAFSDPGIDDYRNELLWTPSTPHLIEVELKLWSGRGELIDQARSYTALRSIGIQGDKFVLNGRPFQLRMVLDQGYWPETGLTAPGDDALRRDVELAKDMGFNGVRKHQKIEDPRYLYWADVLGLLVWEEMPSAYRFTRQSVERLTQEWMLAMQRDMSHPCIIAWVPFNESWGVPDLPDSPAQRHWVQSLYHLTKTLDPTRPVIGNDGWESVATDVIGIHDYDHDPERIARRYGNDESLPRLFKRERPGGRLLLLSEDANTGQPIMLTEFGGIAYSTDASTTWGYTRSETQDAFADQVMELISVVRSLGVLAGFCYTQFADTYQEANGLLYANRTPKFPLQDIAIAVQGPGTSREPSVEWAWRERLMSHQRTRYVIPSEDYQVKR